MLISTEPGVRSGNAQFQWEDVLRMQDLVERDE